MVYINIVLILSACLSFWAQNLVVAQTNICVSNEFVIQSICSTVCVYYIHHIMSVLSSTSANKYIYYILHRIFRAVSIFPLNSKRSNPMAHPGRFAPYSQSTRIFIIIWSMGWSSAMDERPEFSQSSNWLNLLAIHNTLICCGCHFPERMRWTAPRSILFAVKLHINSTWKEIIVCHLRFIYIFIHHNTT